ncbi:nuclear transport factor 2 family protein [Sphingosinicella soli]|uniref:Ketosteroid isomerase-like protein n=1 Tax=Sphingosinicella soli TaxID=333708 RepID=A0A7W7B2K5_9SPHN|nr:nuclear transport factor 2 family protein [Sphingosinicella soli]MBB4631953.1 ketosteroid isomerase-like protein [Sphingosinicella soli]
MTAAAMTGDAGIGGTEQLAARLDRLEAVEAILKVKHRYGELVDRLADRIDQNDLDALCALFTVDAEIDFASMQLSGRQGIVDLYGGQMQESLSWLWHSFHSPIVDIDGDRALGRWTLQGMTIARGATRPDTMYGRYVDELMRVDGRWQISRLQLVLGPAGPQPDLQKG